MMAKDEKEDDDDDEHKLDRISMKPFLFVREVCPNRLSKKILNQIRQNINLNKRRILQKMLP